MRSFRGDDFQALNALINQHLSLVPPGWRLTASDFEVFLKSDGPHVLSGHERCHCEDAWGEHWLQRDPTGHVTRLRCSRSEILVAPAAGALAAAVRWSLADPSDTRWEEEAGHAVVEWLVVDSESAGAARELLQRVEEDVCHAGGKVLHADNSHLGVGWFGIPDTWPRVLEAFAAQGYEREGPWRILTGPVSPPIFEPPAGYSFRWSVDERTREWDLEAYAGEERAGDCSAWGMPPQFDSLEEARRWISIEWIGVEKEHRRRGLGRALLSEQMKFHKARGEQLILWTEAKNEAALRMFTGLGLVLGPTLWPMKKLLG